MHTERSSGTPEQGVETTNIRIVIHSHIQITWKHWPIWLELDVFICVVSCWMTRFVHLLVVRFFFLARTAAVVVVASLLIRVKCYLIALRYELNVLETRKTVRVSEVNECICKSEWAKVKWIRKTMRVWDERKLRLWMSQRVWNEEKSRT